jgi:hypothetical protein
VEDAGLTDHQMQQCPAVVGLGVIVGVLIGAMPRRREQASAIGQVAALSVTTSTGVILVVVMARSKQRRAALASRCGETNTSTTWPNWSIAR